MNVIYTAISGDYDRLRPHPPVKGCQFIAFVDEPEKHANEGWEVRKLIPCHSDPSRNSKRYKILAHEMFPEAKHSLWVDGNIAIQKEFSLNRMIRKYLAEHDMALYRHRKKDCAYREARTCGHCNFDNPSIIEKQMARYHSEGYPAHYGLTENGVILRRHTPAIVLLENRWWKEICKGSRRDQLSLPYVMWKTRVTYSPLPGNIHNNSAFRLHGHGHPHRRFKPPS